MQMPKILVGREFVTITIPRDQLDRKFQGHLATSENKDLRLEELSILGRVGIRSHPHNTWFEVARFTTDVLDTAPPIGSKIYEVEHYDFKNVPPKPELGIDYETVHVESWYKADAVEKAGVVSMPEFTH